MRCFLHYILNGFFFGTFRHYLVACVCVFFKMMKCTKLGKTRRCSTVHSLLAAHFEHFWSFRSPLELQKRGVNYRRERSESFVGKKERKKKPPAPCPFNFFLFLSPLSSLALIALPSSLCSTFPVDTHFLRRHFDPAFKGLCVPLLKP